MGKASEDEVPLDLAEVERLLRERQAEISERVGTLTKPPERGAGVQFGKRVGDGTTEAVSRLTEVGVVRDLSASSERIKRALEKLDEGSYGRCDACGRRFRGGGWSRCRRASSASGARARRRGAVDTRTAPQWRCLRTTLKLRVAGVGSVLPAAVARTENS